MDATGILTQNVDKTQLPPLHQKRVLAFVNHFLISSCGFLNDFAVQCETKFIELERKLQKVEAALTIIEAKLASIPDVEKETEPTTFAKEENNKETSVETIVETEPTPEQQQQVDSIKGIKVSEHEAYKKFFKMLQVGVPAQAIKIKMQVEGLDCSMLDNPNAIIPFENDLSEES
ncbi:WASH complex subunit 3 [Lucilia sericata]|uniref:WASH complex subunit 3 n=1 Tax=Lucilia sericata TaxID=13632 RepID=UPI0018A81AB9|nr:WASH complex subunit 3 [Lucilia sericata]